MTGLVLLLAACAAPTTRSVREGVIATPGIELRAVDGSFTLRSGTVWRPPFELDLWNQGSFDSSTRDLVNRYGSARKLGAKPVRIRLPDREDEYYGLLLLNKTSAAAIGPASRSYEIQIDAENVANASGGKIAVLYEFMQYRSRKQPYDRKTWAWVLWMSNRPF